MKNMNIGRCSRCECSEMRDVHNDGRLHRYCRYYSYICQPVARNCQAPFDGYKIKKDTMEKEK